MTLLVISVSRSPDVCDGNKPGAMSCAVPECSLVIHAAMKHSFEEIFELTMTFLASHWNLYKKS